MICFCLYILTSSQCLFLSLYITLFLCFVNCLASCAVWKSEAGSLLPAASFTTTYVPVAGGVMGQAGSQMRGQQGPSEGAHAGTDLEDFPSDQHSSSRGFLCGCGQHTLTVFCWQWKHTTQLGLQAFHWLIFWRGYHGIIFVLWAEFLLSVFSVVV